MNDGKNKFGICEVCGGKIIYYIKNGERRWKHELGTDCVIEKYTFEYWLNEMFEDYDNFDKDPPGS